MGPAHSCPHCCGSSGSLKLAVEGRSKLAGAHLFIPLEYLMAAKVFLSLL